MNIFLPYKSFEKCAQSLDDRRLSKQILECHQILTMIRKKKDDDSYKNPYLNHLSSNTISTKSITLLSTH